MELSIVGRKHYKPIESLPLLMMNDDNDGGEYGGGNDDDDDKTTTVGLNKSAMVKKDMV